MKCIVKHSLIIYSVMLMILMCLCSEGYAAHKLFDSIDENVDGKVNKKEFSDDMIDYAFDAIDENTNKVISEEEWMSISDVTDKEHHGKLFQNIDKDENKIITLFEFSDYADKYSNIDESFIGLDKDKSNNLSPDEITNRPLFKMITIKVK